MENILVVPKLDFLTKACRTTNDIIFQVNKNGRWMDRKAAEVNTDYLQIIPYIVVTAVRDNQLKVFTYQRSKAGSEERLHGKKSIGIGGHIDENDADLDHKYWSAVVYGASREFNEELITDDPAYEIEFTSKIIYAPIDPVGEVHLGVMCIYNAGDHAVEVRETSKLSGGFLTRDELNAIPTSELETWSVLTRDYLMSEDFEWTTS